MLVSYCSEWITIRSYILRGYEFSKQIENIIIVRMISNRYLAWKVIQRACKHALSNKYIKTWVEEGKQTSASGKRTKIKYVHGTIICSTYTI